MGPSELNSRKGEGIRFNLCLRQLQCRRRIVVEVVPGVGAKSLYCLFGGRLCRGFQVLVGSVSFQNPRL